MNIIGLGVGQAIFGGIVSEVIKKPSVWRQVIGHKSQIARLWDPTKFISNPEMDKKANLMFSGWVKDFNPKYKGQLIDNFGHIPAQRKDQLLKKMSAIFEDYDTFKFTHKQASRLTQNKEELAPLKAQEKILQHKIDEASKELYEELALQEGIKKKPHNEKRILDNLSAAIAHLNSLQTQSDMSPTHHKDAREEVAKELEHLCQELGHYPEELLTKLEQFYDHHKDYENAKKFHYTDSTEWVVITRAISALGCGTVAAGTMWAIDHYKELDIEAQHDIEHEKMVHDLKIMNRLQKQSEIKIRLDTFAISIIHPEINEKVLEIGAKIEANIDAWRLGLRKIDVKGVNRHNKHGYESQLEQLLKLENEINQHFDGVERLVKPIQANKLVDNNALLFTTLSKHKSELTEGDRKKIRDLDQLSKSLHNKNDISDEDIRLLHAIRKELILHVKKIHTISTEDLEPEKNHLHQEYENAQSAMNQESPLKRFFKALL